MTMQAELGNKIETLTAHEATLTMELGNLSTQAKRVGEQLDTRHHSGNSDDRSW